MTWKEGEQGEEEPEVQRNSRLVELFSTRPGLMTLSPGLNVFQFNFIHNQTRTSMYKALAKYYTIIKVSRKKTIQRLEQDSTPATVIEAIKY